MVSAGVLACILAALVLVVIIVAAVVRPRREPFYTLYAQEEPTRSYVPYVGTIAKGVWGGNGLPWAEGTEDPSARACARCVGPRTFTGPLDNAGRPDTDPAAVAEARSLIVARTPLPRLD